MVSTEKGKLFFIECLPWVVIEDEKGKIVTRRVLERTATTCKIRLNNKIKEVAYYR